MMGTRILYVGAAVVGIGFIMSACSPQSEDSTSNTSGNPEGSMTQSGEEHPGEEHPGKEHPGKEHPGDKKSGDGSEKSASKVSASDIKQAMRRHIEQKTAEGKEGVFQITDPESEEELALEFVKIHDPVRKIEGKGYFACTDFSVSGTPEKVYDLDFWLNPSDGQLEVTDTRIHKHPVQKDGEWVKEARYTFKDDEPVEIE